MKAYPFIHKHPTTGNTKLEEGMDLRDYFAARALQSINLPTRLQNANEWTLDTSNAYAKLAYEIADAMMKAREVKHDQP